MKQTILLITFLAGLGASALAQVGIGNVIPDTNSILDLRNTNNRGFLLPDAPGIMPASPKGLMYYNQTENFIYYSDTGGYNALSAWRFKYNGASSNNAYYNFGGNVGIGLPDPQLKLHLKGNDYLLGIEGSSKAGIAFYRTGYSNGRSSRIYQSAIGLYITNYESGDDIKLSVTGGGEVDVYGGNLNVIGTSSGGNLNVTRGKVQEGGDDLIPYGVIVMWSGWTIPGGWRLCNGSYGTPDLRGKFIVGHDSRNPDYNNTGNRSTRGTNNGDQGGSETHKHAINPPSITSSSNGRHRHNINLPEKKASVNGGGKIALNKSSGSSTIRIDYGDEDTDYAGDHTHKTDIGEFDSKSGDSRPPYYTLAFIMKVD